MAEPLLGGGPDGGADDFRCGPPARRFRIRAAASYDEAVANYRQAALTAFQQVEDNLATLRVLEQQAQAQRVAVEAAQQSLDLSLNRYKGGLVTYLEVVTRAEHRAAE